MSNTPTNKLSNFADFSFDNSYAKLPDNFYAKISPTAVEKPVLIKVNESLAKELGLNVKELKSVKGAEFFSGNFIHEGAEPIALAYAGHQFGHFVPQLGDGRAVLLGEVIDKKGCRFDIQLKGSGRTPFSRSGDGRAAIGPVIREYIVSEAMRALGIKTTRSLAAVTTGEPVFRETILPGAILTRVASSHIRVGTFEYFAARKDLDSVKILSDYTIARHYPKCANEENPYAALLKEVTDAQAELIASWMHIGFIHGVMNTDNTSIAGETIDYGPCAFMDEYNPAQVFSSIDRQGRYAYINQPHIAAWNLARFAQTLLPLFDSDLNKSVEIAEGVLENFYNVYENYWLAGMRKKIGLFTEEVGDIELIHELLNIMNKNQADFSNTFRQLSTPNKLDNAFGEWIKKWEKRLQSENKNSEEHFELMNSVNPAFIPRNHNIAKAIKLAEQENDFSIMEEMLSVLSAPYDEQPKFLHYSSAPTPDERVTETFCGT
jgi:uncharacterized protein YdiU (UPF0061 family)